MGMDLGEVMILNLGEAVLRADIRRMAGVVRGMSRR
jgi:hypothetical protein